MAGNRGGGNSRILHPITETPYDAESGQKTWVRGQNYPAHLVSFAPLPNDTEREIIFGEAVPDGTEEGNEFARGYSSGYMADWDIDATRSLLCERVVSVLSDPPTNPLSYERYIVGPSATGRWAGFENHLAYALPDPNRRGLSWLFRKPLGDEICVIGDTGWFRYDALIDEWIAWPPNTFQQLLDTTGPFDATTIGYVPTWDGTNLVLQPSGSFTPHALGSHTDTVFGTPGAGEDTYVVSYDFATNTYVLAPPSAAGPHTIGSHSDANVPSPTNLQVFSWDSGTSKWIARTILLTDLITGGIGTAGQVLTSNGATASFQTPAATPASAALFGVGIRHPLMPDNQAGNLGNANYISGVDTAVCQVRWSNPAGIMETTAGLGYGNIKIPVGYTKARFYCRIAYTGGFSQWENLQFCVVKKNLNFGGSSPSLYLYHPFGIFGGSGTAKNTRQFPDGNFCWPWDDTVPPPTSGPINLNGTFEARLLGRPLLYTDQVYLRANGYVYESMPVDVVAGTVYAVAAKWTVGPPSGGAGSSVSGGAGNGQAVYVFDEWGCYLYV